MSVLCSSLISKDIDFACDEIGIRGVESDGIIINRNDIEFASSTITGNVISDIHITYGKKGYKIIQLGNSPFTGTQSQLNIGTYINTWNHNVSFVVLNNGQDTCNDIIDGLANGSFVVILKNKSQGTDGKDTYQVYGWYQGLKASEITNDKWSEETEGGWLVTLQEQRANKSGVFLWNTDRETTAAMYDSLLTQSTGETPSAGE